jgi:hypothetical protein
MRVFHLTGAAPPAASSSGDGTGPLGLRCATTRGLAARRGCLMLAAPAPDAAACRSQVHGANSAPAAPATSSSCAAGPRPAGGPQPRIAGQRPALQAPASCAPAAPRCCLVCPPRLLRLVRLVHLLRPAPAAPCACCACRAAARRATLLPAAPAAARRAAAHRAASRDDAGAALGPILLARLLCEAGRCGRKRIRAIQAGGGAAPARREQAQAPGAHLGSWRRRSAGRPRGRSPPRRA